MFDLFSSGLICHNDQKTERFLSPSIYLAFLLCLTWYLCVFLKAKKVNDGFLPRSENISGFRILAQDYKHSAEITRANENVFIGKAREYVSQEAANLSRQKRLWRICRCHKYLQKVCVDIQSLFSPRFLSFLCCETVYILPLR